MLTIRPRVVRGERVPYRISMNDRGPSFRKGLAYLQRVGAISINGESTGPSTVGSMGRCLITGSGWSESSMTFDEPGKHAAEVVIRFEIYRSDCDLSNLDKDNLLYEHEVTLTAPFEILDEPEGYFDLIDDPGLVPELTEALEPTQVKLKPATCGDKPYQISCRIAIDPMPINIAFDVFIRAADKETHVGAISRPAGMSGNWTVEGEYDGPLFKACNVILRTSKPAARDTVDLFEIWNGELIYKNVPVSIDKDITN